MSKWCFSKADNFLATILKKKKKKAVTVPQIKFWTELNNSFNSGRNRIDAENFMDYGDVFLKTTFRHLSFPCDKTENQQAPQLLGT